MQILLTFQMLMVFLLGVRLRLKENQMPNLILQILLEQPLLIFQKTIQNSVEPLLLVQGLLNFLEFQV